MSAQPPTPIAVGTYQPGTLVGLGKTASWDYPYVRILQTWTATTYQYPDPITGNQVTAFTLPVEGVHAEYFWPEWSSRIDYSKSSTKPYVPWKVTYNGLYYEPTFWLSSSQIGKNPTIAEAVVGDYVNPEQDYGQYSGGAQKQRCKNQSNPVRCWMCLGSLEEGNGWNTYFGSYAIDQDSGERLHDFGPFMLNEFAYDPSKIGGDAPAGGQYYEQYFPNFEGREWVQDTENSKNGNTYVKPFLGTKDRPEPITWDPNNGNMPTKDIACSSPYSRGYGYTFGYNGYGGISINLWYQKVVSRRYIQQTSSPAQPAGVTIDSKQIAEETVQTSPATENMVHLIDYAPGAGMGSWYWTGGWNGVMGNIFTYFNSDIQSTQGGSGANYWYRSTGGFNIYGQTLHPLVWTRKLSYFEIDRKDLTTYSWYYPPNPNNIDPPPRSAVLQSITQNVSFPSKTVTMGENQIHVGGIDKDGKYHYDNPKHKLGSGSYFTENSWTDLTASAAVRDYYIQGKWADD